MCLLMSLMDAVIVARLNLNHNGIRCNHEFLFFGLGMYYITQTLSIATPKLFS